MVSAMTVYIAPDCPPEVDAMIRAEARDRGEEVMLRRPFPWNRKATDQRVVAERQWRAPTKARKAQLPCDHGLFSDEADQLDLVSLFRER